MTDHITKKILKLAAQCTKYGSGTPEQKYTCIVHNEPSSTTTRKEFFVLLHNLTKEKAITDLSRINLDADVWAFTLKGDVKLETLTTEEIEALNPAVISYSTQVTYNTDTESGLRNAPVIYQRTAKAHERMSVKLAKWVEDFKAEFADDYAELNELLDEMESCTKEVAPDTLELRTKKGSLVATIDKRTFPTSGELQIVRFGDGMRYLRTKRDVLYTFADSYCAALVSDGEPQTPTIKLTPKQKFFKKVREYLKNEGVTNLDQVNIIKRVDCDKPTQYRASVNLKFIGMLNFSEHKSELTMLMQFTKLTRWFEEFKRLTADEYAALDKRVKEMESNTVQSSPSVFTLFTPSGEFISEFTQDDSGQWFRLGEKNYSTKAKVYSRLIEKYEEALKSDEVKCNFLAEAK
ncbi:hypothetical protein [Buttiauxella noackiae]|uniref:hypothetical protein n=1 Tax=Buttiauxella noackiae TaxID=82992 RepID=UPI00054ED90E|nr:hypothetical protein [Buttiauxella noackiae]